MFKSYTRKSSAKIGAERAGKTEADLVQVDGKWGFYENDSIDQSVEAAKPAMVIAILNAVVNNETIVKIDRRKVKRIWNQTLKRQHRMSRKVNCPLGATGDRILQTLRDLGSYRKAKLNRVVAVDDLGNTRVLA